jgi:hypothetical protein
MKHFYFFICATAFFTKMNLSSGGKVVVSSLLKLSRRDTQSAGCNRILTSALSKEDFLQ